MLDYLIDDKGQLKLSKLVPKAFRHGFFINCPLRYRIFKGARNTGKSHTMIGWEALIKLIADSRRNILMARLNLNSHKQSTYSNICGRIYDLGLEKDFDMRENPSPEITYKPTGQKIVFRGMNDPTTINSITFAHGYLTDVYIEEAFEISSFDDFKKLDMSLRQKLPEGLFLQITLCFNAWNANHWINEEFFKGRLEDDYAYLDDPENKYMEYIDPDFIGPGGKGLYLNISTYKCNPFRDKEQVDASAMYMKDHSPGTYKVEFLGMWGNAASSTYEPEFDDACIVSLEQIKTLYGDLYQHDPKKRGFASFAVGIDTGLSSNEGKKRKVTKDQNPTERVKAANTMCLVGVSSDYESIVAIDEYYHTNIQRNMAYNTDSKEILNEAQSVTVMLDTIIAWADKYRVYENGLFAGVAVNIFIDGADVGFYMGMTNEVKIRFRELQAHGLLVNVYQSGSKLSVQTRVDWEKIMFAWGAMKYCDRCKNLIRETRNARGGEDGIARTDEDDHVLTAFEYAYKPLLPDVHRWKQFKQRE